eukprot:1157321-Pelagomonas_calceolata.AAC.3
MLVFLRHLINFGKVLQRGTQCSCSRGMVVPSFVFCVPNSHGDCKENEHIKRLVQDMRAWAPEIRAAEHT